MLRKKVMIYKLTYIAYLMQAPKGRHRLAQGETLRKRESPTKQAPTGRHNSILNGWFNMYLIAKTNLVFDNELMTNYMKIIC